MTCGKKGGCSREVAEEEGVVVIWVAMILVGVAVVGAVE